MRTLKLSAMAAGVTLLFVIQACGPQSGDVNGPDASSGPAPTLDGGCAPSWDGGLPAQAPLFISYLPFASMMPAFDGLEPDGGDTGMRPLAHLPAGTPVLIGNYGPDQTGGQTNLIAQAQATTSAKIFYAPMFSLGQSPYAARAQGVVDDFDHSAQALFDYSQPMPTTPDAGGWSPNSVVAVVDATYSDTGREWQGCLQWGQEMGKRMRDTIETYNRGVDAYNQTNCPQRDHIISWQFDEISPSAATNANLSGRYQYREFLRGVMLGLAYGRTANGVAAMPILGATFISQPAFALGSTDPASDPEILQFWGTLNEVNQFIIGEEYPTPAEGKSGPYDAGTAAADSHFATGQNAYQVGFKGPFTLGTSIANKWIAAASPGYSTEALVGKVPAGMSAQDANYFRTAYFTERAKQHVTGFGEYSWVGGNVDPQVADDTMASLQVAYSFLP